MDTVELDLFEDTFASHQVFDLLKHHVQTVVIGTKPFKSSPKDFFWLLYQTAFIITPPKPVDVLELEIPTRQHLEQVKERLKGDRERTLVRELRLRENGDCVSMMLDTIGLKTVLSDYKNVRTLSLDFGIMKGSLEPGTTRQIFASNGLTQMLRRLPSLKSLKIILHNDTRMGKVRHTLEKQSKWSPESLLSPADAERAMSMIVPHPEDLDKYVAALLPRMTKLRTLEWLWTDSARPQEAEPALHYRKHVDTNAQQLPGDLGHISVFDKGRLI
ncbi:hypothetical protein QFC20_007075 [Naganishia adeliensis]|uniref:Uncharacterized protein n=2 Tax=Naganishia adeliensis TaxID=92952 RepID=A0ACC2V140_9TREE|nr:hypothetical protein QFC20_007407 [Naganishia adeliensis]KAJ9093681.1 hypothetical protein QFC20_007075 [Naganishia adeliensis]